MIQNLLQASHTGIPIVTKQLRKLVMSAKINLLVNWTRHLSQNAHSAVDVVGEEIAAKIKRTRASPLNQNSQSRSL